MPTPIDSRSPSPVGREATPSPEPTSPARIEQRDAYRTPVNRSVSLLEQGRRAHVHGVIRQGPHAGAHISREREATSSPRLPPTLPRTRSHSPFGELQERNYRNREPAPQRVSELRASSPEMPSSPDVFMPSSPPFFTESPPFYAHDLTVEDLQGARTLHEMSGDEAPLGEVEHSGDTTEDDDETLPDLQMYMDSEEHGAPVPQHFVVPPGLLHVPERARFEPVSPSVQVAQTRRNAIAEAVARHAENRSVGAADGYEYQPYAATVFSRLIGLARSRHGLRLSDETQAQDAFSTPGDAAAKNWSGFLPGSQSMFKASVNAQEMIANVVPATLLDYLRIIADGEKLLTFVGGLTFTAQGRHETGWHFQFQQAHQALEDLQRLRNTELVNTCIELVADLPCGDAVAQALTDLRAVLLSHAMERGNHSLGDVFQAVRLDFNDHLVQNVAVEFANRLAQTEGYPAVMEPRNPLSQFAPDEDPRRETVEFYLDLSRRVANQGGAVEANARNLYGMDFQVDDQTVSDTLHLLEDKNSHEDEAFMFWTSEHSALQKALKKEFPEEFAELDAKRRADMNALEEGHPVAPGVNYDELKDRERNWYRSKIEMLIVEHV